MNYEERMKTLRKIYHHCKTAGKIRLIEELRSLKQEGIDVYHPTDLMFLNYAEYNKKTVLKMLKILDKYFERHFKCIMEQLEKVEGW